MTEMRMNKMNLVVKEIIAGKIARTHNTGLASLLLRGGKKAGFVLHKHLYA